MNGATAPPQRRSDGPGAGTPGLLLPVGFSSATGDIHAVLGGMSTSAADRPKMADRLVNQVRLGWIGKDLSRQLKAAHLFIFQVSDLDRGQSSIPFSNA